MESSELDELEHLWENNYDVEDGIETIAGDAVDKQKNHENYENHQQPVNMSLFYEDNTIPMGMESEPLNEVRRNDNNGNESGIIIVDDQDKSGSTA